MNPTDTLERSNSPSRGSQELQRQWTALLRDHPKLRIRDAAEKLGVSELELLLLDDANITPLKGGWSELLKALEPVGDLMALSRNDAAVHEKTGVYKGLRGNDMMGLMIEKEIDLRLIFARWRYAYAVGSPQGRDSIQIFAADGSAIHKIYTTDTSDRYAWQEVVERFELPEEDYQPPAVEAKQTTSVASEPLGADVQASFLSEWDGITDVHQFFGLLKRFEISRLQAMQAAENTWTYPVDVAQLPSFIEELAGTGLSIMVFVSNAGIVQIHTGPIERCMTMGPWFNILDPGFNLHLNTELLGRAWVVRKPTVDGIVSSVEVYDLRGELVMQLFGERGEGNPEQPRWRAELLSLAPDMPALDT